MVCEALVQVALLSVMSRWFVALLVLVLCASPVMRHEMLQNGFGCINGIVPGSILKPADNNFE